MTRPISAPASGERSETAPDWSGPTKAEVHAQSKRAALAQRAAAIAAYRAQHLELNPAASDTTVWSLIFIEQVGKGGATALDSRREQETREEPNS